MATVDPLELIAGSVEKILYTNEENHYTVAQLLPEGRGRVEPVIIVGNLAALNLGETVRAQGRWVNHKQFGRQFAVEKFESVLPRTIVGIQKYLGSGLVKGIGAKFADRIVEKFGEQTLEIIDHFSGKLREVEGIGPERAKRIKEAWTTQKSIRDIMIFLQGHGVGSAHAAKIFRQYGDNAIVVVRENPYQLAKDITGIGFRTADGIAAKLGIAADSIHRLKAGLVHTLERAASEGHTCLPREELIRNACELLEGEPPGEPRLGQSLALQQQVETALNLLLVAADTVADGDFIYLAGLHHSECGVATRLTDLRRAKLELPAIDFEKALAWVQQQTGIALADAQKQAVQTALTAKVCVITGGPGVGKTTIINSIVRILQAKKCAVLLAAPTGRAAKRMSEATGAPAQTIHRLLKYTPHEGGFTHNERRPLKCDLLVIDETSMLDIPLAYHLVKAIPAGASVVFVGDVDQLPSVGPGNFLHDLIESNVIPVVRLTEIFRQAKASFIITNAHRVNAGDLPVLEAPAESDFFFIHEEDPEKVVTTIKTLCRDRIPRKFGLAVQVLTPMHKGVCGAENLNRELQTALNPTGPSLQRYGRTYRVGDRVMQIRNNYDKDVFNGDLGQIKHLDLVDQEFVVEMDGRDVLYDFTDLDELIPAYAITVHKSQGNEYPAVIVPLLTQHYILLQRNLLYTAITRGKKLVILIGSKKALGIAVRNNKTATRYSCLQDRLRTR